MLKVLHRITQVICIHVGARSLLSIYSHLAFSHMNLYAIYILHFLISYLLIFCHIQFAILTLIVDLKSTTKRVWSAPAAASAAGEVSSSLLGIKSKWWPLGVLLSRILSCDWSMSRLQHNTGLWLVTWCQVYHRGITRLSECLLGTNLGGHMVTSAVTTFRQWT